MSIDSTKSSASEGASAASLIEADGASCQPASRISHESLRAPAISERLFLIASIAVLAEAALLRLYDLELKPLHHDEGVNGFFLTRLFREGSYQYDPSNYHGPTLYYFALISSYLFGLNTFAIRLVTAIAGIGTVWLALGLRRRIGAAGALTAAALLAVSPGAVYLSRYFIHESLLVLFTLALVVAALRYRREAQAAHLLLAAAVAALLFATKETAIISAGVLALAAALACAYARLRKRLPPESVSARSEVKQPMRRAALLWIAAVGLFLFLSAAFYTSFFTNLSGISDAIKSFAIWARVGTREHVYEWHTYLWWLLQQEPALTVLGAAGAGLALWRAENRFVIFIALWSIGIVAAYSLIPYKTPWLMLNFLVPLAVAGGYAASAVYSRKEGEARLDATPKRRAAALCLAGAACLLSLYQAVRLNFIHYDDESYVYVYAHTQRDVLPLLQEVKRIAERAAPVERVSIAVTSPEYWPLPWYLRNYRVGYYARVIEASDAIVIGSQDQEPELVAALGGKYTRIDSYILRPGVALALYVRNDLVK